MEIASDYQRIERDTRKLRRQGVRGERFDTVRIEVERHSIAWRLGRIESDELGSGFDPRG